MTPSIFLPQPHGAGMASLSQEHTGSAQSNYSPMSHSDVGQDRLSREAEDAVDRDIKDLDYKAVHAKAAGDHAKAREYADRMMAAIVGRSPEHQARLEREAQARVAQSVDYFGYRGQLAREAEALAARKKGA